jgi:hypothetical protein
LLLDHLLAANLAFAIIVVSFTHKLPKS